MIKEKVQRLSFDSVFDDKSDGTLVPKRVIDVNGITIGPGVKFGRGVKINGVDFFDYKNYDIAASEVNGKWKIVGFFHKK